MSEQVQKLIRELEERHRALGSEAEQLLADLAEVRGEQEALTQALEPLRALTTKRGAGERSPRQEPDNRTAEDIVHGVEKPPEKPRGRYGQRKASGKPPLSPEVMRDWVIARGEPFTLLDAAREMECSRARIGQVLKPLVQKGIVQKAGGVGNEPHVYSYSPPTGPGAAALADAQRGGVSEGAPESAGGAPVATSSVEIAQQISDKQVAKLVSEAARQGARVTRGAKHIVIYPPDSAHRAVTISVNGGDPRYFKNVRAQLRRGGIDV